MGRVSAEASELAEIAAMLRGAGCVFAEEEARVLAAAADSPSELSDMVRRRAEGLPLEHVVGRAEFCGLRVVVTPGVFVPRRRSEFLVRVAVRCAPARAVHGGGCVVVDLCCGTGAVGMAVSAGLGGTELHAVDIDQAAVACARQNLAGSARVYQGDLYAPLPTRLRGRVDVLVANAPYVPSGQIGLMPAEARLHEPAIALDGGPDGVDVHRSIAAGAPGWLSPGGILVIETSERQAPLTAAAVQRAGLTATVVTDPDWSAAAVVGRR
jgi:release factor glutamine methyltransferase